MITIKTIAVPKQGSNYYGSSSSSSNLPSNITTVDISGLDLMWKKGEGKNSLIPTYSNNATSNESEVAVGHFNILNEGALFEVGNGTDDENRSNALTVFSNGKSVSPIFNATTSIDTPLALVTKLQSNTIVNTGDVKSNTFTGDSASITTINGTTASISTINSNTIANTGTINTDTINSNNITNTDTIKTKNLEVTGSAHFFELIIDKIKSAGGSIMLTPADGFEVEKIKSMANNITLYWRCQDGNGKQRDNMWKVNDQALCMSFNQATVGTSHNVNNKYYWCLVTDVSDNNNPIEIDGQFYNYISISRFDSVGVVNPEVGDSIVMCGYRGTDDAARQSAIYISAYSSLDNGLKAPLFAQYQGINDFNLESHRKSFYDANRAKFIGEFEATDGQNIIDIINNKIAESEASIKLNTKNIVLSVSEKTQERRNLLVGSDFKRKINNFTISTEARIEMNSGYNGTNCIKVIDDTDGTSHYIGVYWDGSQGGRSVKIEKGKKYTISCYYKTNDSNAKFSLEAIYTDKETNAERLGRPRFLSPSSFKPKYNQWELFTTVIDTTDAESDYIAFNFWEYCNVNAGRINAYICRPMVEEGDTYYGWTLSDEDNDYVGANLIDNSRTFQVGGNTLEAIGTKTLKGDVYELTYKGSAQYNTFYRIDTTNFKLDTDYTLSFDVRGDAKLIGVHAYYPMTKTPYMLLNEAMDKQMYEQSGDGNSEEWTTLLTNSDIEKEKKLWVHFMFKKRLPRYIYFQFQKNSDQSGVTSWTVSITKPKIEEGANVTQWTEKKTDVEKSITTITNNVATLTQKANSIESNVTSNTTNINNITGQLSSQSTSISRLEQKADSITSTVSNMTKGNGANIFSFTNTDFQNYWCRSAIQMNGFFTLKLNQRIYRLQNLGTNNEGGDFVVSFDARVLKNTTINVNFCDIGAAENNGDIALTTAFQHYVLHFKNIQSDYLNKAIYNGFIDFEPKTPDETNQLYVANFMLERGTIPSEKFSISEADRNNYGNGNSFKDWEKDPRVQIVNDTINGKSVQAYKIEGVPSGETYINMLQARNLQKSMKIQPQKVYTLSFWAKASESGHGIYCYLWPDISDIGLNGVIYKGVNGAGTQEQKTSSVDGSTLCGIDSTWRKFYIHWHPHKVGDTIHCNVGRVYANMAVWLSDVKLEEGYICDENLTNQETYSSIKQTADSITSTVSSMKDEILGANCMLGLNGQGWSSNTIYEDAGNSFHCESTDWFQSPPIMDFSGDYTFSFGLWNDNLQIKILDFTQTYYDDGIYDQYVDFGTYTPCKILTTSATVPNGALVNYATSGTSSNWTYTNTETITLKVGDNVAVRVTNGDNKRYNSIYGTVSSINTNSKSVTVRAIALLDQPNTICTLTCPKDKKDGTDINSLHYDEKLGRYWIRFKESRGTAKTFVMLFRNLSTSSIGWISRLMLEESVEYPHKYNNTGQTSQSMIKQTANEILMSVNDTYLKIGDGNITLNGDTKVNGSLTLSDKKQGFLLVGNGGTTEISPNSIGTYNEFTNKTTNVIKTHYDSKIYGYKAEDGDYYRFSWTVLQRLGTFKKGTYIKILNYTNSAYAIGATSHISTPYATFYIYENGTTTKTINVNNETSVDIANYTVVGDNVDVIVDGHFTIGVPTSIWGANGNPHPAIAVSVNWNNEVPKTSSTFMLIGYDGFAANFGTNTTVYCGKDGFIANYGDSLFKITQDGIVEKRNRASIKVIEGSTSSSNPYTYEVPDTVDTILCKTGNTIIKLPSKPYQGQKVKIYDKSRNGESWINFQGYMVRANETYNNRRYQSKFPCDGQYVRIYTFIDDTWYEEFTG